MQKLFLIKHDIDSFDTRARVIIAIFFMILHNRQ